MQSTSGQISNTPSKLVFLGNFLLYRSAIVYAEKQQPIPSHEDYEISPECSSPEERWEARENSSHLTDLNAKFEIFIIIQF